MLSSLIVGADILKNTLELTGVFPVPFTVDNFKAARCAEIYGNLFLYLFLFKYICLIGPFKLRPFMADIQNLRSQ
jgi:hypothetical protein